MHRGICHYLIQKKKEFIMKIEKRIKWSVSKEIVYNEANQNYIE